MLAAYHWDQDKVGRIVIDGVVDSEDYYAGKNHKKDARYGRLILLLQGFGRTTYAIPMQRCLIYFSPVFALDQRNVICTNMMLDLLLCV